MVEECISDMMLHFEFFSLSCEKDYCISYNSSGPIVAYLSGATHNLLKMIIMTAVRNM